MLLEGEVSKANCATKSKLDETLWWIDKSLWWSHQSQNSNCKQDWCREPHNEDPWIWSSLKNGWFLPNGYCDRLTP